MFYLRQADKRGRTQTDWLDSRHTFSFGQYYDPRFMAFSDLRVINDDVVAPSGGFGFLRRQSRLSCRAFWSGNGRDSPCCRV